VVSARDRENRDVRLGSMPPRRCAIAAIALVAALCALPILAVYSMVGGIPHHLHYRCEVCNITATAPGPCWCCGAPFELREERVEPSAHAERDPR
jgi:hypothetical protein